MVPRPRLLYLSVLLSPEEMITSTVQELKGQESRKVWPFKGDFLEVTHISNGHKITAREI
jgi:hypothetical protein